jgi:hypothetical protein
MSNCELFTTFGHKKLYVLVSGCTTQVFSVFLAFCFHICSPEIVLFSLSCVTVVI